MLTLRQVRVLMLMLMIILSEIQQESQESWPEAELSHMHLNTAALRTSAFAFREKDAVELTGL